MLPTFDDWTESTAPGRSGTRLHTIWRGMQKRCHNPKVEAYQYYGARGIIVSPQWRTFFGFLDWALASGYANNKQIDRINADGPYSPYNCRWVIPAINRARGELDRDGSYLAKLHGALTDEAVSAAIPKERAYRLVDGHGLYLSVSPTGAKSWRYRYRIEGREKILTIGRYPNVSLAEAREVHAISRQRVKRQLDPAKMKQSAKARRKKSTS